MQYFKDRTESFDDYYPCKNNKQLWFITCIQLDKIIYLSV